MKLRPFLYLVVLTFFVGGCAKDEIDYKPSARSGLGGARSAVGKAGPPQAEPEIIKKVGKIDFTRFGIPSFPEAKADENLAFTNPSKKGKARSLHITLESSGTVNEISKWYATQIKAKHAYVAGANELGTLDGTTKTGYPISISVASIDSNTMIVITVEDTRKK